MDNQPVIIYTLQAFEHHPNIDAICVVCLDGWHDVLWAYAKQFNITKLRHIVSGGPSGQASIYNGLMELKKHYAESDIVVIHDGNRPLVSAEIISDSLVQCKIHGGAVAAIPCTEAVFVSKDREVSNQMLNRDELIRTQTPHTYPLGKLIWAHEQARQRGIQNSVATCTLLCELGEPIHFSKGSERNLKITTVEDLDLFKSLLSCEKVNWLK